MKQTNINGHHDSHYPIGEAVWILAGMIVLIAFGDLLILLALAFAVVTMTTAWWTYRTVEHRVERNDAELATVTHLPAAFSDKRDLEKTSTRASWRGPSAAA